LQFLASVDVGHAELGVVELLLAHHAWLAQALVDVQNDLGIDVMGIELADPPPDHFGL
jgi:hypothetical protein